MLRGLCGICSGTGWFAGMLRVPERLWLSGILHSSAASVTGGLRRHREGGGPAVPCQPLGLAEELRSSPSSFLGSLLQLSGALMPRLALCQDPACTRAADPPSHAQGKPSASLHPQLLCPCPCAACSPGARPPPWHPARCRCCPSCAKPLCSRCAGAANPSARSTGQGQVSATPGQGSTPLGLTQPQGQPRCAPHAGESPCVG